MRNGFLVAIGFLFFVTGADAKVYRFPTNFKWCAATAPHQIEGYNYDSDWWTFENWPPMCNGGECRCTVKNCEKSGPAIDHWNRVDEDTQLMRDLNLKQYRFGIEWAKVEPREGQINWDVVAHYRREIDLMVKAGIEPMVTLQHFTMPQWLRDKGGWSWDGAPRAFQNFTKFVYTQIAPNVRDWITINEPLVHLGGGYLMGLTPPAHKPSGGVGHSAPVTASGCVKDERGGSGNPAIGSPTPQDFQRLVLPLRGLLKAHAAAYNMLHYLARQRGQQIRVGMAHHMRVFYPRVVFNPLDWIVAKYFDDLFNWAVPNALETGTIKMSIPFFFHYEEFIPELKKTQDFFGINYYTRDIVWLILNKGASIGMCTRNGSALNDMGWEIYPNGFYDLLRAVGDRFPGKSVLVTENGLADANDSKRKAFIREHLRAMHAAIRAGVPIEAYCHWSLMDNYEWVEGFGPRFGLYEVDYANGFKRTLRSSGRYYSEISRTNSLDTAW